MRIASVKRRRGRPTGENPAGTFKVTVIGPSEKANGIQWSMLASIDWCLAGWIQEAYLGVEAAGKKAYGQH
jgi:hypothetical protein